MRPLVARVVDGGVLEGPECLAIAYTMDAAATVKRAVATSGRPRLTELVGRMGSFDAALRIVREQLDAQGEVRDDATPKLREIRRRLQPLRGRIRERMAQLLQQYATHVQDPIVTLRRDRYVIPVKASAQSRVPGLVLDTSDSGATVFVEPAAVVPMNNELTLLEFEERDEVRRILVALGQRLAFEPALAPTLEALDELDLVVASARARARLEAGAPGGRRRPAGAVARRPPSAHRELRAQRRLARRRGARCWCSRAPTPGARPCCSRRSAWPCSWPTRGSSSRPAPPARPRAG